MLIQDGSGYVLNTPMCYDLSLQFIFRRESLSKQYSTWVAMH